jgi:hypothetical protein
MTLVRAAAALVVVILCGLAVNGAAAGPTLTPAQAQRIESEIRDAYSYEQLAIRDIGRRADKAATGAVELSNKDLARASVAIAEADIQAVGSPVSTAHAADAVAVLKLERGHPGAAVKLIEEALVEKQLALHRLAQLGTGSPAPFTVTACGFLASQDPTADGVDVKVVSTPGTSVTVAVNAGGTPQTKTGIVGTAGSVIVGPFFEPPSGTAAISVIAANPTTGQSQSHAVTFAWTQGAGPATDCQAH